MGWQELTTDDGIPYYYNPDTQETRWDKPDDDYSNSAPSYPAPYDSGSSPAPSPPPSSNMTSSSPSSSGCNCCGCWSTFTDKAFGCFKEGGCCGCCQVIGWRGRMRIFANIGVLLVALEHIYFFISETFLLNELGTTILSFYTDQQLSECATTIGKQGVYDLVLALGLLWGLFLSLFSWGKHLPKWRGWGGTEGDGPHQRWEAYHLKLFFLVAIIGVGVFAGVQMDLPLVFIQSLPAFIVAILVVLGGSGTEDA